MLPRALSVTRALRIALVGLLAISVLAPSPAAAGRPSQITVTSDALNGPVSDGASVAWRVSFTNGGPGTITHLRFAGSADGASFDRSSSPCDSSGSEIVCEVGKLKAGQSFELTLVFTAGESGDVELRGQFQRVPGNGTEKVKDTWQVASASVEIINSPGFFGTWQPAHGNLHTFATLTSEGQQSTVTAHPVATDYPVVLNQVAGDIDCALADELGDGFGEILDLSVADGGTAIDVTIVYAPGAVDKKAWKVKLLHQLDDGSCVAVPLCDGCNDGNCFVAYYEGEYYDKHLVIEAQLPHNGRVKGY